MDSMKIVPVPSGMKLAEVFWRGPPLEDVVAAEYLYSGDFVRITGDGAVRCGMYDADRVAFSSCQKGEIARVFDFRAGESAHD